MISESLGGENFSQGDGVGVLDLLPHVHQHHAFGVHQPEACTDSHMTLTYTQTSLDVGRTVQACHAVLLLFRTMYPPETVRQVVFAVDRLVTGSDVIEVAGFLEAVGGKKGLQGKEAMVAVHLRWDS